VADPSDHGCLAAPTCGEKDQVAEERNPVGMTEEEIAEASGELLPERRAMSVIREEEPLPQPIGPDAVPSASLEDPPPAS
jgi:hypothetical protein